MACTNINNFIVINYIRLGVPEDMHTGLSDDAHMKMKKKGGRDPKTDINIPTTNRLKTNKIIRMVIFIILFLFCIFVYTKKKNTTAPG